MLRKIILPLLIGATILLPTRVNSYVYCGFHENNLTMMAIHWNSDFWVNMLVSEANKWNAIQPILTINRTRRSTVPAGRDNTNVISWIAEADLNRFYGLSWSGVLAWTITWANNNCGRIVEADMFFNPGLTLFTPQTQVPYNLGYQETALHELGHVCTQDHEDRTLAVMTAGMAVSNVLYASDKVGWFRSADFRFNPADRRDIGVFPLRNGGSNKIYSTVDPATVRRGSVINIRDFSIQNLSSGINAADVPFRVFLENVGTGASTEIGSFTFSGGGYSNWEGNMNFSIPSVSAGNYRVVAVCQSADNNNSNNRADFGQIRIL